MNPLPPRRWFQFRLSTWFVLVAVAAWALALGPFVGTTRCDFGEHSNRDYFFVSWGVVNAESTARGHISDLILGPAPEILYPLLALAAFVGWKAAWAIGRLARRKAEGSP